MGLTGTSSNNPDGVTMQYLVKGDDGILVDDVVATISIGYITR